MPLEPFANVIMRVDVPRNVEERWRILFTDTRHTGVRRCGNSFTCLVRHVLPVAEVMVTADFARKIILVFLTFSYC